MQKISYGLSYLFARISDAHKSFKIYYDYNGLHYKLELWPLLYGNVVLEPCSF